MSDLVAFLNARTDEDEAEARATADSDADFWADEAGSETHFDRWNPARVLREVEAKRKILAEYAVAHGSFDDIYAGTERETGFRLAMSMTLKTLATTYRDHPDYDPNWRTDAPT